MNTPIHPNTLAWYDCCISSLVFCLMFGLVVVRLACVCVCVCVCVCCVVLLLEKGWSQRNVLPNLNCTRSLTVLCRYLVLSKAKNEICKCECVRFQNILEIRFTLVIVLLDTVRLLRPGVFRSRVEPAVLRILLPSARFVTTFLHDPAPTDGMTASHTFCEKHCRKWLVKKRCFNSWH